MRILISILFLIFSIPTPALARNCHCQHEPDTAGVYLYCDSVMVTSYAASQFHPRYVMGVCEFDLLRIKETNFSSCQCEVDQSGYEKLSGRNPSGQPEKISGAFFRPLPKPQVTEDQISFLPPDLARIVLQYLKDPTPCEKRLEELKRIGMCITQR